MKADDKILLVGGIPSASVSHDVGGIICKAQELLSGGHHYHDYLTRNPLCLTRLYRYILSVLC